MGGATFPEMSPDCLRKVSEQAREDKSVAVSIHSLSSYYGFSCQQIVTCKMRRTSLHVALAMTFTTETKKQTRTHGSHTWAHTGGH